MLWNTLLTLIPVLFGVMLGHQARKKMPRLYSVHGIFHLTSLVFLFFLWLAFLPNTCYLLTEWRHLLEWVDYNDIYQRSRPGSTPFIIFEQALFYLAYSSLGVLTLTLAIRPVERAFRERKVSFAWLAVPLFPLLSLGVYLGLIVRLNSWDMWARPEWVWQSIVNALSNFLLLLAIFVFALLLWGMYAATSILLDHFGRRRLSVAAQSG